MLRVKGQDGFLPIGPAVVTSDEWSPDGGYNLRTYLNGEVVQEAATRTTSSGTTATSSPTSAG